MPPAFTFIACLRFTFATTALVASAYVAALVRTTEPGFTTPTLLCEIVLASIIAGPIAALAFIRSKPSRFPAFFAAVVISGVLTAEVWAGVEEYRFASQYQTVASGPKPRFIFSDTWLSYDPVTRVLRGGD
jgi:hypothetical protein